jgi:hypothetical protein
MTKLDEAVEAALEAYQNRRIYPQRVAITAAIQAAVTVLVPDDQLYDDVVDAGNVPAPALLGIGWNNCRAVTLKNAGIE